MSEVILEDNEWKNLFKKLTGNLKRVNDYMEAAMLTRGTKDLTDHFDREESPNGKWQSRSPITQKSYASRGKSDSRYNPANKILQLTGRLRQSVGKGGLKINKSSYGVIIASSRVEYSGKHDEGLEGMPKREFMWLSEGSKQDMLKIIMESIAKGL